MAENKLVDLVLEGGGVKGIALVGAISEMVHAGYSIQRVAGASAGAIVGAFVASGCSPERMSEIMRSVEYEKFQDATWLSRFGTAGKLASAIFLNGMYKGDYFEKWIEQQLLECGVKTFGDLKLAGPEFQKLPSNMAYKLVVVVGDLSKGELVYLPWDYHKYGLDPDQQSVAKAVRASMAIPFFFKPASIGGSTLIDGGWLSNFPVDAFDQPISAQPDWPTIGINLGAGEDSRLTPREISGPISFAKALLDTATNGHDQRHINNPATLARTMFVEVGKIKSIDFNLNKSQQDFLYENGRSAAKKFLKNWDYETYKIKFNNS